LAGGTQQPKPTRRTLKTCCALGRSSTKFFGRVGDVRTSCICIWCKAARSGCATPQLGEAPGLPGWEDGASCSAFAWDRKRIAFGRPEFDDIGTVVLRAVDRDPVLCSRHDAHFRLLSAQEKALACMGARVSRPDGVRGWGLGLGALHPALVIQRRARPCGSLPGKAQRPRAAAMHR